MSEYSTDEENKALLLGNSASGDLTATFIQGTRVINPPVKPNAWIDESRTTGREVVIAWNYYDRGTANRATGNPNDDNSASSSWESGVAIPLQHTGLGPMPTRSEVFWEPNEGDSPRRTTENRMTIAVEPGKKYLIWTRGVNIDKPGPISEKLLFRSAPLKPINLNVRERHDNSVKVEFEDQEPGRRSKRYRVSVRNESGEVQKNGVVLTKFYIARDLTPGGHFQISVQEIEKNGKFEFESDEASVHFTLRPPAPENITCKPEQDGYKLCWDKVAVATKYKVSWRCGSEKACFVTICSTFLHLKQTELQTETYYDIIVRAVDDQGKESKSVVTELRTGPAKPSDLKVGPVGNYSIMVTFREVTSALNTYKVVAKPVDGGKEVQKQTDMHSVKLDLEPGKDYEIYVHAEYKGQQSVPARYVELVHTRPAKVKHVEIKNEGNSMFKIKWEKVNGAAEYHVTLNGKKLAETEELEYILTDLDRMRNHVVEVRASNDVGESAKCQVKILAGPVKPSDVKVDLAGDYSIMVTFQEATSAPNTHKVVAKPVGGGLCKEASTDMHSVKLDLEPGEDYEIYVYAEYKGQQSFPARYDKLVHTRPAKFENVKINNEGNNMFKVKWEKVNGAAEYHVTLNGKNLAKTEELEYILTDLDRARNHVVEVRASNDVGKSAKCQAEILAAPTNIRISIASLDTVEIKCDECHGAKNYVFTINSKRVGTEEMPICKLSFETECKEFTVKVRGNSEDAEGAESETYFRHVVSIVQEHFKGIAERILPPERYVIPKTATVWPRDCAETYGSEDFATLQTKEVVLVQGGHFCGKTSMCAHFIQNNQSNDLVIYVDAHHFVNDVTCDIKSFLSKIELLEGEYERLQTWMKNHSEKVKFVVDNAMISCTTTSSGNSEEIFITRFERQRGIFPNSCVLFTSSWNTQNQNQGYSRVLNIIGFLDDEVEQMKKKIGYSGIAIPENLKWLCVNPGFCKIILENRGEQTTCLGKCLTEVISKLINRVLQANRPRKIASIMEDIESFGKTTDIGPMVKKNSKKADSILCDNSINDLQTCEDLELEYKTVLYWAYFMKNDTFKKYFSTGTRIFSKRPKRNLCIRPHARKWEAIADLLRQEEFQRERPSDFQQAILEKSYDVQLKLERMRKFVKEKQRKLTNLIRQDQELAANWFTIIVNLDAADIFKKPNIDVKTKNESEWKNAQSFLQLAPKEIGERIRLKKCGHTEFNGAYSVLEEHTE